MQIETSVIISIIAGLGVIINTITSFVGFFPKSQANNIALLQQDLKNTKDDVDIMKKDDTVNKLGKDFQDHKIEYTRTITRLTTNTEELLRVNEKQSQKLELLLDRTNRPKE